MLPSTYYKLEYIESTGTQRIDIGLMGTSYDQIEMMCATTDASRSPQAFINGGSSNLVCGVTMLYGGSISFMLLWGSGRTSSVIKPIDTDYHVFKTENVDDEEYYGMMYIDDTSDQIKFPAYSQDSYTLFNSSYMRLKYFKLWDENDELVRDLVPALRKSDKKPGLYDLENDVFYTNQGSGEFLYELKFNSRIKKNGVWKDAVAYIKKNGSWKIATPMVKKNGVWKS